LSTFEERHLLKQPLTETELRDLAKAVGGIRNLVAPRRRAETEAIPDDALYRFLAENPTHVRRPIIVTEKGVIAGFAKDNQAQLEAMLPKKGQRRSKT
jgi:arsenate reductase-like glutaredoxin family protein